MRLGFRYVSPSPLRGSGGVGSRAAPAPPRRMARWRTGVRSSLDSNRRKPRPGFGIDCAASNSTAFVFDGRAPSDLTSSISSAPLRGLSLNSMAVNTRTSKLTTTGEQNGCKSVVTGYCVSGTTTLWETRTAFSRKSSGRPGNPPLPNPPPPGGRECSWGAETFLVPSRGGGNAFVVRMSYTLPP